MRIRVDMSPASTSYRNADLTDLASDGETVDFPPADPSQPGELPLTAGLIAAFKQSLSSRRINVRFFHGAWDSFVVASPYDIVLTSETIYRPASLGSLVDLMRRATAGRSDVEEGGGSLVDTAAQLSISGDSLKTLASAPYLCLVAAKLVYFGVGGGVNEFVSEVEGRSTRRGRVQTIWEQNRGVKRSVLRVVWETL